ncbi:MULTISPECIES: hypothetical protein [Nocardia]|uniref:hypothetical protein n=1 Tax=Nocardia TaxID=1817 RepID=UPI0024571590|nr:MULTISPECIES: hypothetical protein [Nocardia]
MITTDGELIAALAERTGCGHDDLFMPVTWGRIRNTFAYPLDTAAAEQVMQQIIEEMTCVVEVGVPAEADPMSRYVWLQEMVTRYQSCETRKVAIRVSAAGRMPAWTLSGDGYDPLAHGWDLDPDDYPHELVAQARTWAWWNRVKAAGVRENWRMPSPYAGAASDVPIDDALDERDSTGDQAGYRRALKRIRDANYRDVDAWAHSGHDALARADAVVGTSRKSNARRAALLTEALGFYQTGVVVGELSLPAGFTGVLPWSYIENRPFHRARHGLALAWWRLGDFARAATVLRSGLCINPDDNQGLRELLPLVESRIAYEDTDID